MLKSKMISKKKIITILAIVFLSYVAVVRISTYIAGSWSCRVEWKESGMDYKYKFGAGCMISPDGNWVPARNYRID